MRGFVPATGVQRAAGARVTFQEGPKYGDLQTSGLPHTASTRCSPFSLNCGPCSTALMASASSAILRPISLLASASISASSAPVRLLKTRSISSNVAPFVSGSWKCTQTMPPARKTAKKMYVPQAQAESIGGTKKATAKLLTWESQFWHTSPYSDELTQLLDAPIEAPLDRIDNGKISDTNVQETGPQVAPKAPT